MNLTADPSRPAVRRHLEESLAVVICASRCGALTREIRWIDVGSGAGFPGLVVAASTPCQVTLVEPRKRRAAFLELACHAIERCSSVVLRERVGSSTWMEKVVGGQDSRFSDSFDVATARAVMGPVEWLELGKNVVKDGGLVLVEASGELPEASNVRDVRYLRSVESVMGGVHAFRRVDSGVSRGTR
jgi:16S rRNA (guanine527-N7)-methyltransferase